MSSYLDKLTMESNFDSCCSNFYQDELIRFFLGDSYHPGGIELTLELAEKMGITKDSRVLDVACGIGTSSLAIAEKYGCQVVGIDMNTTNIALARQRSEALGLSDIAKFVHGKAGKENGHPSYSHILCECSFCIFDDKQEIAKWFYNNLASDGILGISDVAIERQMPYDLSKMVYQVACVSGAVSTKDYRRIFETNGFRNSDIFDRGDVILDLYNQLKKKLIGLKLVKSVKKEIKGVKLDEIDLGEIKKVINQLREFVDQQYGTYFLYIGQK